MSAVNSHEADLGHSLALPAEIEDDGGDIQEPDSGAGDYTTRMEEVLGQEDDDDEEEFLYQGADSQEASATYNEQLRTFIEGLDEVNSEMNDHEEELQVEEELNGTAPSEPLEVNASSSRSPSTTSLSFSNFRPAETSSIINDSYLKPSKPFIHPSISRLRSITSPQHNKRFSSVSSLPQASPSPSHFSAISRASSISNFPVNSSPQEGRHDDPRQVFRWAVLRDIGQQVFLHKSTSSLGSYHGLPTVLSTNGLICIGTDQGRVLVFDFKQQLKCICGVDDESMLAGPVSALALSRDHTFVAVGHVSGHINLYDLSRPQTPARSVLPTSLAAIASGRKEGHIEGCQILSLAFVGARHTAIVSADEWGLAFYHSLGKVLFVEATDTLRILGRYPDPARDMPRYRNFTDNPKRTPSNMNGAESTPVKSPRPRPWRPRKSSTILAMTSLPLGTLAHSTEGYHLIALLTPLKLVIVGLQPSPRTWFRRHRNNTAELSSDTSRRRGCLAWFPSIDPGSESSNGVSPLPSHANGKESVKQHVGTDPVLAYSWDRTLYLLRVFETKVKQRVQSSKNPGKMIIVEVGKVDFEEVARWSTDSDYLVIQWLNVHQVLALTNTHLEVWDVRTSQQVERVSFDVTTLSRNSEFVETQNPAWIAHRLRVYKGKVFLLGRTELKVGTLLSWADRILAYVEEGDFLSAINITRAYYQGTAPGNRMGLPDDPATLRKLVGQRMRDLMTASARYAFAEDRMTDSTHVTPDGRGVDRTSLFEGLVTECINACIALDDFEFLFEDLFDYYSNAGIASIFLKQLEPYILDGTIRSIPPRITQRLISMHEERGNLNKAERVIWHIDPDCLDVNQAITLCRSNNLYEALIYVYTRALHDFVTPLVVLLGLIRQIQRYRREQRLHPIPSSLPSNQMIESSVLNAYKVYTYLADVLSGLSYPGRTPVPAEEALQAKKDIYAFLFFGRSYVWPVGQSGELILTSDEDGGVEPTYPYVRLLLRFDAEAFLHSMDIAFEDTYFNDDSQGVSRLVVVRVLIEILSSPDLSPSDATMLNIFLARNVPKYPQSIRTYMAPSTLHGILVGLAKDTDQSTREDRQLAAEYLLSTYMPHDSEGVINSFEDAGFYRILRRWHRQEHRWVSLVCTYLNDPDIDPAEVFENLDEVLSVASRTNKGVLPADVQTTIMHAIPQLLDICVTETAFLIDAHAHESHRLVLETIGPTASHRQFAYLRSLVEPGTLPDELYWTDPTVRRVPPSQNLDEFSKESYVRLLCEYDPPGVIRCLSNRDSGYFDWDRVIQICEQSEVDEAVVWCLDKRGNGTQAFEKLKTTITRQASQLGTHLVLQRQDPETSMETQRSLKELKALGEIGLRLCTEHSYGASPDPLAEDMWFALLSSQINAVQEVSNLCPSNPMDEDLVAMQEERTLDSLRSLVHATFTSLMALGSSPVLSFPRLFKRLVDAASISRPSSRSSYSEFRLILTGMLESYRGEGDLLLITNRLVERDLFTTVEELAHYRSRGSRIRTAFCTACKCSLQENTLLNDSEDNAGRENGISKTRGVDTEVEGWSIQLSSGLPYHHKCLRIPIEQT